MGKFQPGQSGNPGGRPKRRPFKEALDRVLRVDSDESELDGVIAAIVAKAKAGDVAAAREIADRLDGKAAQAIEGSDGGPVQINVSWKR